MLNELEYQLMGGMIKLIENIQNFKKIQDQIILNLCAVFYIDPLIYCNNHCSVNDKNKMILDYLNIDKEHLSFV